MSDTQVSAGPGDLHGPGGDCFPSGREETQRGTEQATRKRGRSVGHPKLQPRGQNPAKSLGGPATETPTPTNTPSFHIVASTPFNDTDQEQSEH